MSPEAKDLIVGLLILSPEERITKSGSAAIKSHPFFAGIDWDGLRASPGPIIPQRTTDDKVTNRSFDDQEKIDPFFKECSKTPNHCEVPPFAPIKPIYFPISPSLPS